jgi:hypothetical protein
MGLYMGIGARVVIAGIKFTERELEGPRVFITGARFSGKELDMIDKRAQQLGMDRSELMRKASLGLCKVKVSLVPEHVEKYYLNLCKNKMIECLGPRNNGNSKMLDILERIK